MATGPISDLPFVPAPVRRSAAEPLYAQVAKDLASHVRTGTMAPGQRLPPEPVLAGAYGVNRLTVREALTSLSRQGLVRRVQGVGSFVADAPVRHRVDAAEASMADALRRRGVAIHEALLEALPGPPEAVPGGPFPAFPGPVTILWTRCVTEEVPWALSLTWVPAGLVPADVRITPETSIFSLVLERHRLQAIPSDRTVAAAPAAPSDSEHLDVPTGTPLIVLSGGNVDQHGRRIAQVAHRIRGDRAEYAVDFRTRA
jgi:DNA-binding GntR family transcriptional regulator